MKRHATVVFLVAFLFLVVGGCERSTTVVGRLVLESGVVGDVSGSSVELYETFDLSGSPVAMTVSDTGFDHRLSRFEVDQVAAGTYYILAWSDVDGNGTISDRDIVGVGGGDYRPGYGGSPIEVFEGARIDARDINMEVYAEVVDSVAGFRTAGGDTTFFIYSFNYDVVVVSLSIEFPEFGTLIDPEASGDKTAGVVYRSDGWSRGGDAMPSGLHHLYVTGRLDGDQFDLEFRLDVE
jgi:hypothetical protein